MTASTVFLAPLGIEAAAMRLGAKEAVIERIGMGPDKATRAAAALVARLDPACPVVVLGLGGALDAKLRAGEVIVASSLCTSDGAKRHELGDPSGVVELLEEAGLSVRVGTIACTEKIVKGIKEREQLEGIGAVAVEMESMWCLSLARGRPFAVVRVILDVVGREVFSLKTPPALIKAARSLASASRALVRWSPDNVDRYPTPEVGT